MPGMSPRYPEGSLGVWASPKPRDGGLIFCQQEYPRSAGRQGSPSISFHVRAMGPPPPGNGSLGVQADGQLCGRGRGHSAGQRRCRAPEPSLGLGGACACLKEGRARALGWQLCDWETGALEAYGSLRGLGLGTDVHLASRNEGVCNLTMSLLEAQTPSLGVAKPPSGTQRS